MALGRTRIVLGNETEFSHEREALDYAIEQLPNDDPYQVWGLVDLLDPSSGRLYEIDLLVLGYNALYLVEIKSGPGTYRGDSVDWVRAVPGERDRYMENPYRLTNHKSKVLASLLERKMEHAPWVQPLVFLSHPETNLALSSDGLVGVVTRNTFKRAVSHHEFPGAPHNRSSARVNKKQAHDLARALQELGVRPRKGQLHVGEYELGAVLEDGPGYQDRIAVHRERPTIRRRARIYLVPQQTSTERRSTLRRAADREAALLDELREHSGVLQFSSYVADAPLGPTVLFDAFEGGLRLDAFLRQNPALSFSERIELIAQIGRALGHCHRRTILHGGLSPESVLVRAREGAGLDVRLFNFQLGSAVDRVEATAHISALTGQTSVLYQPPEVRENPLKRDVEGDIYSLGVLAYLILTGQPPAPDLAALEARLSRQRELDPRATDDSVPAKVAELIACATNVRPVERFNDAIEWVEFLLQEATAPDKPTVASYVDPLVAVKEDRIAADLEVLKAVGQGATARVLRVRQDGSDRELAAKVSLGPDHDERIRTEGQTLRSLRDAHIVECFETRDIGGRAALMLSYVPGTLLKRLADEGTIGLDFAVRWGEDLLSALLALELADVTHRDIKPANLGLGGAAKKAEKLVLFDFSLSHGDRRVIEVGTAAYRDPFLRTRGAWDAAADRWSSALVLHEMLTGVRPTFSDGSSSLDAGAKIALAADRFPAGLRDLLVQFFDKAFQRDVAQRFASAEAMRRAWSALASEDLRAREVQGSGAETPEIPPLTDEEVAQIPGSAMIASLRLDERAKNALDRAGVLRVRDLLLLPHNQLSAIRGVGRKVVKEIFGFRDRWSKLRAETVAPEDPFFARYRGEDLAVESAGFDEPVRDALLDAGLRTLGQVASAADEHLLTIAQKRKFDVAVVRRVLDAENRRVEEHARPTTLEGWIDALFPPKKKALRTARVLLGLDPIVDDAGKILAPALPTGATVGQTAKALRVTEPAVYIALGKNRIKWGEHPAKDDLVTLAKRVVDEAGGAVALSDGAVKLLTLLPHDRTREPSRLQTEAAALLRLVTELRRVDEAGEEVPWLRLFRLDEQAWLSRDPAAAGVVRALGTAAAELASRNPLASPAEAQRVLVEAAGESDFSRLPFEQLARLAVAASNTAACSTRLEIYPRSLDPKRSLEMTAALVTHGVTPEDVRRRVRDRYPDAAEIPGRPELDALLRERFGLEWRESEQRYERPGAIVTTTQHTSFASAGQGPSSIALAADDLGTGEFAEKLRHAVEKRLLRILPVHSHRAKAAERKLQKLLGVPVRALDAMLIERIEHHALAKKVQPSAIHAADREGPTGKHWGNLRKLAELAAKDLEAALLPAREPLLLTRPGLLARYRLSGFLHALVAVSKRDDCAAIFLLLPSHDRNEAPVINGELAIPGLLPSERLWVPSAWIGTSAASGSYHAVPQPSPAHASVAGDVSTSSTPHGRP